MTKYLHIVNASWLLASPGGDHKFPRHKFLISLSISDIIQITVTGLFAIISRVFHLRTTSTSCQVLRQVVEFNTGITVVSASTSIIALSVERYIELNVLTLFRKYVS